MASVNRVMLIGHVGKTPETRSLQDGTQIVSFSLATSESWTDRASGERKEKTEWHRIVVMGNDHLTKLAAERVKKGSKLYLEGKLQTRKWERDGVDHYTTEVLIGRFNASIILLSDTRGEEPADDPYERARPASVGAPRQAPAASQTGAVHRGAAARTQTQFGGGDLDDEIPF